MKTLILFFICSLCSTAFAEDEQVKTVVCGDGVTRQVDCHGLQGIPCSFFIGEEEYIFRLWDDDKNIRAQPRVRGGGRYAYDPSRELICTPTSYGPMQR